MSKFLDYARYSKHPKHVIKESSVNKNISTYISLDSIDRHISARLVQAARVCLSAFNNETSNLSNKLQCNSNQWEYSSIALLYKQPSADDKQGFYCKVQILVTIVPRLRWIGSQNNESEYS